MSSLSPTSRPVLDLLGLKDPLSISNLCKLGHFAIFLLLRQCLEKLPTISKVVLITNFVIIDFCAANICN
jgi:hypothetical protein